MLPKDHVQEKQSETGSVNKQTQSNGNSIPEGTPVEAKRRTFLKGILVPALLAEGLSDTPKLVNPLSRYTLSTQSTGDQWSQSEPITPSDGEDGDEFGKSVAFDGNTALIGAPFEDQRGGDAGAAYIFEFTDNSWKETHKLTASDGSADDRFGSDVALDGDTAFVGAELNDGGEGAAYVFEFTDSSWTETAKLTASNDFSGRFGCTVALEGDTAFIGAPLENNENGLDAGAVYIFTFDDTLWTQTQKLTDSQPTTEDRFGNAVALDGNTAMIGSFGDDSQAGNAGAVSVFEFDGSSWVETQTLTSSDAGAQNKFGWSIALDNDRAIIGETRTSNTSSDTRQGAAYVFDFDGSSWVESKKLTASDTEPDEEDAFGASVGVIGDTAFIATKYFRDILQSSKGAVYVYEFDGLDWKEIQILTAENDGNSLGSAISSDDNTVLIGAHRAHPEEINEPTGVVHVFGSSTKISLQLEDPRLVQTVENTRIGGSNKPLDNSVYTDTADDPDLVSGRQTIAAFDLKTRSGEDISLSSDVEAAIFKNGEEKGTITLSAETAERAVNQSSVLDEIMVNENLRSSYPVFHVKEDDSVTIVLSAHDENVEAFGTSFAIGDSGLSIASTPVLNIGILPVVNEDAYGSFLDSKREKYESKVEDIARFIQRSYPTNQVNVYHGMVAERVTGTEEKGNFIEDLRQVHETLFDEILPVVSEPEQVTTVKNGEIGESAERIDTFDETFTLVPDGYFDYHNESGKFGFHPNWIILGHDPRQPPAASVARFSIPVDNATVQEIAAHEIGHHFIGSQFPNKYDEENVGMHLSSDVKSNRFDLEQGSLSAEPSRFSFMNFSGWTDALTHQFLIDGGFDPVPPIGSRIEDTVLTFFALIDSVNTVINLTTNIRSTAFVTNVVGGAITLRTTSADGLLLDERQLPDAISLTPSNSTSSSSRMILGGVPFPDEAYKLTFGVEDPESGEVTETEVIPVAESLFTAVNQIPDNGFTRRTDERRTALNNKLDEIEEKMEAKEFQEAKQQLENDFRRMIKRWLKDKYEAAANQPTKQEMLNLVDDMIARLETLAQEAS